MATTTYIFENTNIDIDRTTFNPDEILKDHLKDMELDNTPEEFNYFHVNLDISCWTPTLSIGFSTNRVFGVTNIPLWKGFVVKATEKGLKPFYAHYTIKTMSLEKNKLRVVYSEGNYYEDITEYRTEVFYIDKYKVYYDNQIYDYFEFERYFDQYHYNNFEFILNEINSK